MNKVILMGRLVADPEVRYSQAAEPLAIVRIRIAVNRRFKREGEPDADFFNCVAFGKTGEFLSKYFKKGNMISVVGRLSNSTWQDKTTGQNRTSTEVVIEENYFCGGKNETSSQSYSDYNGSASNSNSSAQDNAPASDDFYKVEQSVNDDDVPF
jgi:single-strand DNA-binding protein